MPNEFETFSRAAVARRLRKARESKYSTAADLARALGMKEVTVRAHENGQNGLKQGLARKYADALGVSPSWLLYGEGKERTLGPFNLGAFDRDLSEAYVDRIGKRVGVWQNAREGKFEVIPPYLPPYANEYLSMTVTGYERLQADGHMVTDDHAASVYPPGRYVIQGPIERLDLREGDHIVVVKTLPNSTLSETTVRGVTLTGNEIILTSLRVAADQNERVGSLSLSDVPSADISLTLAVRSGLISLNEDLKAPIEKLLEMEGLSLTGPGIPAWHADVHVDRLEYKKLWDRVIKLVEATGAFVPNFSNPTDQPRYDILGVVLADYSQRERSGTTIARRDRRTNALVLPENVASVDRDDTET